MSSKTWRKGYKEVKNVIHSEIGVTKDEILQIFHQVAKDEIQNIVSEKRSFIYETLQRIIKEEMVAAIQNQKYPKLSKNIWNYTSENQFKDYVADIMKEEILDLLRSQFELNFNISKK